MPTLREVVNYCDERVRLDSVADFPGAMNGLQVENSGRVTRIGAAVDAGLVPFQQAVAAKVDFLIVHHGMFWEQPRPFTGAVHRKLKTLLRGDCAVYSAHLPLDAHPEIGNNAILAKKIGLEPADTFLPHQGTDIGLIGKSPLTRRELKSRLQKLFPAGIIALEFGSSQPRRVAVLTGSGRQALPELKRHRVDTLITGELKQESFNFAQEEKLNFFLCGHYATETFGVCALAAELARKFQVPWKFIRTACPL